MIKQFLFILFIINYAPIFSQNITAIDAVKGVGEYKFGLKKESFDCINYEETGWCWAFPENFLIGGFKVSSIKLGIDERRGGLYIIDVRITSVLLDGKYNEIVSQLKKKYGTPTDIVDREGYKNTKWKGNKVEIVVHDEVYEDHPSRSLITISYEKLKLVEKKEVGF